MQQREYIDPTEMLCDSLFTGARGGVNTDISLSAGSVALRSVVSGQVSAVWSVPSGLCTDVCNPRCVLPVFDVRSVSSCK